MYGSLERGLWFAVNEVVHHGDVVIWAIVRTERDGAVLDPNARDDRLFECHAQKREAVIGDGHGKLSQRLIVAIEILERRVLRIDVSVHGAKPSYQRGRLGSRDEEG